MDWSQFIAQALLSIFLAEVSEKAFSTTSKGDLVLRAVYVCVFYALIHFTINP